MVRQGPGPGRRNPGRPAPAVEVHSRTGCPLAYAGLIGHRRWRSIRRNQLFIRSRRRTAEESWPAHASARARRRSHQAARSKGPTPRAAPNGGRRPQKTPSGPWQGEQHRLTLEKGPPSTIKLFCMALSMTESTDTVPSRLNKPQPRRCAAESERLHSGSYIKDRTTPKPYRVSQRSGGGDDPNCATAGHRTSPHQGYDVRCRPMAANDASRIQRPTCSSRPDAARDDGSPSAPAREWPVKRIARELTARAEAGRSESSAEQAPTTPAKPSCLRNSRAIEAGCCVAPRTHAGRTVPAEASDQLRPNCLTPPAPCAERRGVVITSGESACWPLASTRNRPLTEAPDELARGPGSETTSRSMDVQVSRCAA